VDPSTGPKVETERRKLNDQLRELAQAHRAYGGNAAAKALIEGHMKRIRDRLYELDRSAPPVQ